MSNTTDEDDRKANNHGIDWDLLIGRIKDGNCTPFLGAGACHPLLPLGSEIATDWAKKYNYPLEDSWDLVRVAQFLAIIKDPMFPKEKMATLIKNNTKLPDFNNHYKLHSVLADLPLPVYLTTNYDNFMAQALETRKKDVKREFCRWNRFVRNHPSQSIFESKPNGFDPTPANPVVYHLHGLDEVLESIVITRDDYLDFLVNINRDIDIIPPRIRRAFGGSTLLFLGYGLEDWNFRVVFRHIASYLESSISRTHVSVQLAPGDDNGSKEDAISYLNKYFGKLDIQVYWGTCDDFARDLRTRWEEFDDGI